MRFPNPYIDPLKKGKNWLLQYAQAVKYQHRNMFGPFSEEYANRISLWKAYMRAEQPTENYKTKLSLSDLGLPNYTELQLDMTPLPFGAVLRTKALNRIKEFDYNIVANPVDARSMSESDEEVKRMEAKLKIREAAKKVAPEMLQDPMIQKQPMEPDTLEEFEEIWKPYRYKHRAAYEAETIVKAVFQENSIQDLREQWRKDLWDVGIAIARDCIDKNGRIAIKRIDPRKFGCSYTEDPTMRDISYAFELKDMTIGELREDAGNELEYEDYLKLAETANKQEFDQLFRNHRDDRAWFFNHFKIKVLDLELVTIDLTKEEIRKNKYGNIAITKTSPEKKEKEGNHYRTEKIRKIYGIKWIVDTEYCYQYGPVKNQKRESRTRNSNGISFQPVAIDLDHGVPMGYAVKMIPLIDSIQINWLRIQACLLTAVPSGVSIEMDALEDVNLTMSGMDMTPEKLVKLFMSRGVLMWRRKGLNNLPENAPPIQTIANGVDPSISIYWDNIIRAYEMLRQIVGLNDMTDGATPNPKTLSVPAELAAQGTVNALGDITSSDEKLLVSCAEAVHERMVSLAVAGVKTYDFAIGSETREFINLHKDLSLRKLGISVEKAPTEKERQQLIEEAKIFVNNGLEYEDILDLKDYTNLKEAKAMLRFKMAKRKSDAMAMKQQSMQMEMQMEAQKDGAKVQSEMGKIQLEYDLKLRNMQEEYRLQAAIKEMELASESEKTDKNNAIRAAGILSNIQNSPAQETMKGETAVDNGRPAE